MSAEVFREGLCKIVGLGVYTEIDLLEEGQVQRRANDIPGALRKDNMATVITLVDG